ncbi:Hsp20/alpha crystallin family protein [Diaphorobacter sp.]|uniref:Hsp20/alpha crystallin family protein n=1 Tax=Diaphorobacter sp. TaxID=1934310 RepID=UPI0025860E43|nr:Hsp20/alpha crystallin family protein [Diaphorobacter sp.]
MIFTPLMTRRATSAPRPSDVALQRFLVGALQARPAARPAGVTVTQDDKATTLQLDVPGLAREQLQITIEGKQVQVQSMEGAPRQVRRAWELAEDIDAAASTARLEHGVLTLTLAKRPPAAKAVEITVH